MRRTAVLAVVAAALALPSAGLAAWGSNAWGSAHPRGGIGFHLPLGGGTFH